MAEVSTPSRVMVPRSTGMSLGGRGGGFSDSVMQVCGVADVCKQAALSLRPTARSYLGNTPAPRPVPPLWTSLPHLKSVNMRLLLPLPVRPTTPQEQPPGRLKVRSRSTGGSPGR
jgi:hypothetical protein